MRAIWIDAGNDADEHRLRRLNILEPYFDIRDPRVTSDYLKGLRERGFSPGVYAAWNWQTWTGVQFAEWVSQKLKTLPQNPAFPKVHLDIETHDVPSIIECFRRYRALRPKRITGWTLESHQGGLFTSSHVAAITACNVDILPQAYEGDMTRQESDRVVIDLIARGFPVNRIWCRGRDILTVVEEAVSVFGGDRQADYGPVERNFQRIADMWSIYLGVEITPRNVGWMMTLLKASRDAHQPKRDNLVDGIGYLALIGEMESNRSVS